MIYWIELLISKSRGNKIYVSGQDKVVLTIYALKHAYIIHHFNTTWIQQ